MQNPKVIRRCEMQEQVGRYAVSMMVQKGQVLEIWPGVLIGRDHRLDRCARAQAGLLYGGPHAVLSRRTAALFQGCQSAAAHDVHLTIPYHCFARSHPGLRVHRGGVTEDDVEIVNGLRTQTLEAAITEVLCTERRREAFVMSEEAASLRPGLEFRAEIAARLEERRDRRGTIQAFELLDLVTGLAESPRESWLRLAVVDAGFPVPVPQIEIVDLDDVVRWILDMGWPELKIALEYDGYEAHEKRKARDAARDADLERRGWIVIHIDAHDLRNPRRWISRLIDAFRSRGVRDLDIVMPG